MKVVRRRRIRVEKHCRGCGGVLQRDEDGAPARSRYCSKICMQVSHGRMKNCILCHTQFVSKNPEQKFCSRKCVGLSLRTTKQTSKCTHCGTRFIPRDSRHKNCSVQCRYDEMNAKRKEINEQHRQARKAEAVRNYELWALQKNTWEHWCQVVANRKPKPKADRGWLERCHSAVKVNRGRVASTKPQRQLVDVAVVSWESHCEKIADRKQIKEKNAWKYKCGNVASNQSKRMRRKSVLQRKRCTD